MNLSLDDLIEFINESTDSIKVKVPSDDYYARAGDTTDYTLDYINPHALIAKLTESQKRENGNQ